jgi:uncharacterized protein (DUF2147 family)
MKYLSCMLLWTFATIASLSPAMAAGPYGKWLRPSNSAEVVFYDCGGLLCGKVASKGRSKATVGTVIVNGAAKSGQDQWKGSLLDPDSGKTYSGVITLVSANGLNLKGCAFGVFCQGETWLRVK